VSFPAVITSRTSQPHLWHSGHHRCMPPIPSRRFPVACAVTRLVVALASPSLSLCAIPVRPTGPSGLLTSPIDASTPLPVWVANHSPNCRMRKSSCSMPAAHWPVPKTSLMSGLWLDPALRPLAAHRDCCGECPLISSICSSRRHFRDPRRAPTEATCGRPPSNGGALSGLI
jgi:hypothetical protein